MGRMKTTDLCHRVELQQRAATVDDLGQPSTTWQTVGLLWANVRHASGLSAIKSGADTSITKASIRARHGAFNAGQRVVHNSQVFEVQAVLPDGKRQYVDLVCELINGATHA